MAAGKIIGYIRVSSFEQNPGRQLEGIKTDRVFMDKTSGKDTERPQLKELLKYVRDGDTVVVHSLDRLARNLDDLRRLVQELTVKEVKVQFIKENLTFTGEDSPMAHLLLSVMGAFAEFERALIRERQMEGIAIAKKKGIYKGRKRALSEEQLKDMQLRIASGQKKAHIAKSLGVSRVTLYQYLNAACTSCGE
ncbi:recombinase family protein [Candidatus Odyssella acanthamoebae]|uniref:Transposon Tn21 resolvase n=1 Tax=Candidatus Odyssella acanthamoebae TaxID=91604 RepID=A0A077ASQ5_9PROT|nr:recombinase family protein [Candidatus Paracaedibacter acanthamoebae]AIK96232.1 transposon Tn21 resolvase [Candidatus Paracaedibacter acanthamoebae]